MVISNEALVADANKSGEIATFADRGDNENRRGGGNERSRR